MGAANASWERNILKGVFLKLIIDSHNSHIKFCVSTLTNDIHFFTAYGGYKGDKGDRGPKGQSGDTIRGPPGPPGLITYIHILNNGTYSTVLSIYL